MVNNCAGAKFMHAKGLQQGHPASPLLFIIAMDVLTSLIIKAHNQGILSPIASCTPMQRLSLYADDVVLYIRPTRPELQLVKDLLGIFGVASGLKVNYASLRQFS